MTSPARLRRIAGIFSLFALLTTPLFAQQDTVFWFVAPEVSQGNQNLDRPVAFRFSSYAQPAVVTISQPANPGFVPQTVTLAANASGQVQFPPDSLPPRSQHIMRYSADNRRSTPNCSP
jgi:hypothetical protein